MPKAMRVTAATATSDANKARINAMFDAMAPHLDYLAARWRDEREYEDFAEYEASVTARLPAGFKLVKMSKRPFGFTFTIGTPAVYSMACAGRSIAWKRIS